MRIVGQLGLNAYTI